MEEVLDLQTAFNMAVAIGAFLGGWVLNTMWQSIKDMQASDSSLADKVSKIEVLVAGSYITRTEHEASMVKLETVLVRIENKLDRKADR